MQKTVFEIPKMDCPSEERLVRMALDGAAVDQMEFDLGRRRVTVFHNSRPEQVLAHLEPLNFGARIAETGTATASDEERARAETPSASGERRTLVLLLGINAVMFFGEFIAGWVAQSTGLIADSLDMFADAAVYGLSLYAVGRGAATQRLAARLSGYTQLLLALGAFAEVIRRFVAGSEPEPPMMMGVALLALVANVTCMVLIAKHREGGVHMRASWIFSTNDVIANLGVVVAGALVAVFDSRFPDLVVGTVIAAVVFSGAIRILRLPRPARPAG